MTEALAKVCEIGVGLGGGVGGALHQVLREEGGAFGVDFFLHPFEERDEVAFLDAGEDFGFLCGAVVKLGRVEISE